MKELLEELKAKWRPSQEEVNEVGKAAAAFVKKLGSSLKRARLKAKPVVGGSGAKGTWLRGMHDIDVFVCFDYAKYKGKSAELSEFLAAAMKKAFPKHERLHGSRDYFRIQFRRSGMYKSCSGRIAQSAMADLYNRQSRFVPSNGYNFEIVPILTIKKSGQALNITDVSLLHSAWVRKQIGKSRKAALDDEIRLTKAFCKAQRVYGAESYVRGFSGYACEVLTAYYGSFLKLVSAAATKWKKQITAKKKIIVDAANHYKKRDPLRELNQAKVQSELIVIDPVQADRNATAALSNETLNTFIEAADAFIKKPEKSFFEKQEITIDKLRQEAKGKQLVIVEAGPVRGKDDVVGAKLVKAFEHILLQLKEKGFAVAESGWEWEKNRKGNALFWYIMKRGVPEPEVRYGPPLSNKTHAEKFREEHQGKKGRQLFEKNGRLYAKIERTYKQPQQLISQLTAEDNYLKDKAQQYSVK